MSIDPIQTLVGVRTAVGVSSWAAPRVAGRAFGLDVDGNPQAPYLARLFGIRDVALAAGVRQSTGDARRAWLKLGLLCDAMDAAAGELARRDGSLPPFAAVLVTGTALAAVGLGVAALQQ
ncbi:MAG: hypothetical protein QOE86_4157 [Solirubrobacteraceae bacterium]|jgi:hypothetical protein|nr:hypothetical protein [Solirubrobacteraceae bacterium]